MTAQIATVLAIVLSSSTIGAFVVRVAHKRFFKPWLQEELASIREVASVAASEATATNAAVNHVGPSDLNLITLAQSTYVHMQALDSKVTDGFERIDRRMTNQDTILTGHLAWHSKEEQ